MSWVIRGFEEKGDTLTTEIEIDDLIREWFRSALGVPSTDPMVDVFPLPREILGRFLGSLDVTIDEKREDFFLDYEVEPKE
jgi:hypothetical protein